MERNQQLHDSTSISKSLVLLYLSMFLERTAFYCARSIFIFYMLFVVKMGEEESTLAYSIFTASILLGKIPGGLIADFFGRRRIMIIGGFFQAAGILLLSAEKGSLFWSAFTLLIVGNILYTPAIFGFFGQLWQSRPNKLDFGFTLNYLFVYGGAFVGGTLTPLWMMTMGSTGFSYDSSPILIVAGVAMLVATILCFFLTRHEQSEHTSQPPAKISRIRLASLLVISLLFWCFYSAGQSAFMGIISQSNSSNRTFDLFLSFSTMGACIALALCWYFLRWSPALKMASGAFAVALAFLGYRFANPTILDHSTAFTGVAILMGLGEALISPIIHSFLVQIAPKKYLSTWFGILNATFYGATLLSGVFFPFQNRMALFVSACGLVALAVLIYVTLKEKSGKDEGLLDTMLED